MSESIGLRYRSSGFCLLPRLPGWFLGQQHCTAQIHPVQAANSDRIGQRAQTAGSNPRVQAGSSDTELRQRDRTCESKQQPRSRFGQRAQTGGSNATQHSVTAHRQIPLGLIGTSGHLHIHIYIYIYIYIYSHACIDIDSLYVYTFVSVRGVVPYGRVQRDTLWCRICIYISHIHVCLG